MAFSTHDQVTDSPTNVFATLNPLSGNIDPTDGNLKIAPSNAHSSAGTTMFVNSGKWYVEYYGTWSNHPAIVFYQPEAIDAALYSGGVSNVTNVWYWRASGSVSTTGWSGSTSSAPTWSSGQIVGVLLDYDNDGIFGFVNGSAVNSGNKLFSTSILDKKFGVTIKAYDGAHYINYGQDPTFGGNKSPSSTYSDANGIGSFYYQPPTGALALCTANLPDPDIDPAVDDLPEDYFKSVIYTGNGSTQSITSVGFQPDLVWCKNRTTSGSNHRLFDSVRGASSILYSSLTNAAATDATGLTSFDSTGFSIGANQVNDNNANFVAWCFRAGGAPTADNTASSGAMTANSVSVDGTLQSSYTPSGSPTIYPKRMSVNTKAGFSIIKYTGTGSAATVPHGLSSAPEFVIIKGLNNAYEWVVYHDSVSSMNTKRLVLNDTSAASDQSSGPWDSTSPNSNVVSIGTHLNVNQNTKDLIMYCWHSVAVYSAFGSYTGNGSADGPFVYTGFKPAYVMRKATGLTYGWYIDDNRRNPHNMINDFIRADTSDAEGVDDANYGIDLLSNGFKVRSSHITQNNSGSTYIYAAFAEMPFKYSATNAR
jgi:hypothetical protein